MNSRGQGNDDGGQQPDSAQIHQAGFSKRAPVKKSQRDAEYQHGTGSFGGGSRFIGGMSAMITAMANTIQHNTPTKSVFRICAVASLASGPRRRKALPIVRGIRASEDIVSNQTHYISLLSGPQRNLKVARRIDEIDTANFIWETGIGGHPACSIERRSAWCGSEISRASAMCCSSAEASQQIDLLRKITYKKKPKKKKKKKKKGK